MNRADLKCFKGRRGALPTERLQAAAQHCLTALKPRLNSEYRLTTPRMANRTPAEMLGVNKGTDKNPDLTRICFIVDSDINIKTVIINGEVFK